MAHLEYLQKLEAAKSFEFDDDEVFCPFHLLTEDDVGFTIALVAVRSWRSTKC